MNLANHPCFNDKTRHTFGRVHLPVAPRCNIQCNFCNRQYDCVNESRPGVTSEVLLPQQALVYLERVFQKRRDITVVGIAGPGDPFANPDETMETLRLIRQVYPEVLLCLASNGLNIGPYLDELAELKVSHVTITVNVIDPAVAAQIYAWVRYGKRVYRAEEGVKLLWQAQQEAIVGLKERGITVKVNTVIIPGINDEHVEAVAQRMAELKVDILNCIPYYQNSGSAFANLAPPSPQVVQEIKKKAGQYLPQMSHCARCRADAIGLLAEKPDAVWMNRLHEAKQSSTVFDPKRPYVAVASREGVLVNQHLGEATSLLIYGEREGQSTLLETRSTPETGNGMQRWEQLAALVGDCRTILVSGIGGNPRQVLAHSGIEIIIMEGVIEEAVQSLFDGRSLNHLLKRERTVCSGTGAGCL